MPELNDKLKGRVQELTDEDLGGLDINDLNCRGCSGYGNCGYRSYRLYKGKAVSLCVSRMDDLKAQGAES